MREDGLSHIPFHPFSQKAAPAGQIYPPPSARPFFKGLLYWHAKNAICKKNQYSLKYENTAFPTLKHYPRGEDGERSETDRVLAV